MTGSVMTPTSSQLSSPMMQTVVENGNNIFSTTMGDILNNKKKGELITLKTIQRQQSIENGLSPLSIDQKSAMRTGANVGGSASTAKHVKNDEESFENAIEMIQSRQMGFRKAADFFSVSKWKLYKTARKRGIYAEIKKQNLEAQSLTKIPSNVQHFVDLDVYKENNNNCTTDVNVASSKPHHIGSDDEICVVESSNGVLDVKTPMMMTRPQPPPPPFYTGSDISALSEGRGEMYQTHNRTTSSNNSSFTFRHDQQVSRMSSPSSHLKESPLQQMKSENVVHHNNQTTMGSPNNDNIPNATRAQHEMMLLNKKRAAACAAFQLFNKTSQNNQNAHQMFMNNNNFLTINNNLIIGDHGEKGAGVVGSPLMLMDPLLKSRSGGFANGTATATNKLIQQQKIASVLNEERERIAKSCHKSLRLQHMNGNEQQLLLARQRQAASLSPASTVRFNPSTTTTHDMANSRPNSHAAPNSLQHHYDDAVATTPRGVKKAKYGFSAAHKVDDDHLISSSTNRSSFGERHEDGNMRPIHLPVKRLANGGEASSSSFEMGRYVVGSSIGGSGSSHSHHMNEGGDVREEQVLDLQVRRKRGGGVDVGEQLKTMTTLATRKSFAEHEKSISSKSTSTSSIYHRRDSNNHSPGTHHLTLPVLSQAGYLQPQTRKCSDGETLPPYSDSGSSTKSPDTTMNDSNTEDDETLKTTHNNNNSSKLISP